ncbi:hypothetical protein GWI33_020377 [Rhynchophorus ferrugineus]|uniref:Uncharacterized protein n=1 Tax=Rhynchophorus ferrugineus TaxID=354439 RepID=A0A834HQT8_RHYFE|nr:hypothetical protein GWI33_020377 [Rhynchophorus ferrugineus]
MVSCSIKYNLGNTKVGYDMGSHKDDTDPEQEVLASGLHEDSFIDLSAGGKKKPSIITFNSCIKEGVGTTDKL